MQHAPSPITSTALLGLLLLLPACASYGWSDRARTPSAEDGSRAVTLAAITAPASRQLDLRLGTEQLAARLERCGITTRPGAARPDMAHMSCHADSSRSRGAGQALWADVSLLCTVTRDAVSHPIEVRAQRMIMPHELASASLALTQHHADTDALLAAIAQVDCPSLDGAPLGTN